VSARRLVLVGHGMVGQRFLENIAQAKDRFAVTVLGEEPRPAYDRVNLTRSSAGRGGLRVAGATGAAGEDPPPSTKGVA